MGPKDSGTDPSWVIPDTDITRSVLGPVRVGTEPVHKHIEDYLPPNSLYDNRHIAMHRNRV
eukprot:405831-Amphidinium_carterae.1